MIEDNWYDATVSLLKCDQRQAKETLRSDTHEFPNPLAPPPTSESRD